MLLPAAGANLAARADAVYGAFATAAAVVEGCACTVAGCRVAVIAGLPNPTRTAVAVKVHAKGERTPRRKRVGGSKLKGVRGGGCRSVDDTVPGAGLGVCKLGACRPCSPSFGGIAVAHRLLGAAVVAHGASATARRVCRVFGARGAESDFWVSADAAAVVLGGAFSVARCVVGMLTAGPSKPRVAAAHPL